MYNIEATIRAFKQALATGTGESIRIVAHSDYYVIEDKQGIIMSEFDFTDKTGHRKYTHLYTYHDDHTFTRIQHPLVYDLEFSLTIYSNLLAKIWRIQEDVQRYFLGARMLEVTVTHGEGDDAKDYEFEHEMEMTEAFRGTFRANLSDLKQMEARIIIRGIPVYAIETPLTGSLITDILMRIEDDTLEDEDPTVLDLYKVPDDSEVDW
jgi:hypothetical protein